ncbi:phosphoglucomutase/phosphomannomutase family protein [bacterium]|nr:phosphoglucomutase/phosphomannomutase family protein [bacterium]
MKFRFGTDGWRAIIADEFTFANVRTVAQAIALYMREKGTAVKGAIVGYDARFLSPEFAQEVAEVLSDYGINVFLPTRDVPTPAIAYSIKDLKTGGAVMITASHNPPIYSGIKFIPEYIHPALPDVTDRIEELIDDVLKGKGEAPGNIKGRIKRFDPFPAYKEQLAKVVDFPLLRTRPLHAIYDPLYASGRGFVDGILNELGWKVEVLHGVRNPLFGELLPDPSEGNLIELREKLKKKADIGLSTDGDADRFGIVDTGGEFITPNEVFTIVLKYLFEERKERGAIVRSIATTNMLDALSKIYQLPLIEVPVGFKFVGKAMKEEDGLLGCEESGGMTIKGHIPEKDGVLACLLMCEVRARWGVPFREVLERIKEEIGPFFFRRIDIPLEGRKEEILENFKKDATSLAGLKVTDIISVDGVKLKFEDGSWLLLRPSGTEPVIRCYMETHSQEKLQELSEKIKQMIK